MALLHNKEFLLQEHDFLKVRQRALKYKIDAYEIKGIFLYNNIVEFRIKSQTIKGMIYTVLVEFEHELILKLFTEDYTPKELENLIYAGQLKVYCDCPAFRWWGYEYIAWRLGYGIFKQVIFPKVRNKNLRGNVCKHIYFIIYTMPWKKICKVLNNNLVGKSFNEIQLANKKRLSEYLKELK